MKNLVLFSASWCGPCQQLKKTIAVTDLGIPVRSVDVDSDPVAAADYSIRGVPTLILIEDNQVVKRKSGAMSSQQLKEFIA
jgi:thioredoxin-like negative regulator of GroEL